MIHDTQSAQISQRQDECNLYAIMKTLWPLAYHLNGFVATHALGHMMYGYNIYVYNVYIYHVYIYTPASCALFIYSFISQEREIEKVPKI